MHPDVPWYQQPAVKNALLLFGRAIQGRAPYDVLIEPAVNTSYGGYCSFRQRKISANPIFFAVAAPEQYLLTKALLVHEAGHRRHTTPTVIPAAARTIANVLEDERIERRMAAEFRGVRWLIEKLATRLYDEAEPMDHTSDAPLEVMTYILQHRWAVRVGKPVKGGLSPHNQQLWPKIQPLVEQAWQAEHATIVDRYALRIAALLGLHQEA